MRRVSHSVVDTESGVTYRYTPELYINYCFDTSLRVTNIFNKELNEIFV
jgi:hypothetical protein